MSSASALEHVNLEQLQHLARGALPFLPEAEHHLDTCSPCLLRLREQRVMLEAIRRRAWRRSPRPEEEVTEVVRRWLCGEPLLDHERSIITGLSTQQIWVDTAQGLACDLTGLGAELDFDALEQQCGAALRVDQAELAVLSQEGRTAAAPILPAVSLEASRAGWLPDGVSRLWLGLRELLEPLQQAWSPQGLGVALSLALTLTMGVLIGTRLEPGLFPWGDRPSEYHERPEDNPAGAEAVKTGTERTGTEKTGTEPVVRPRASNPGRAELHLWARVYRQDREGTGQWRKAGELEPMVVLPPPLPESPVLPARAVPLQAESMESSVRCQPGDRVIFSIQATGTGLLSLWTRVPPQPWQEQVRTGPVTLNGGALELPLPPNRSLGEEGKPEWGLELSARSGWQEFAVSLSSSIPTTNPSAWLERILDRPDASSAGVKLACEVP